MKLTIANAALVLSMSSFASAATINVNAFVDLNFTTNADQPSTLDGSYTAYVGNYTGGALNLQSTFSDINASWSGVGSYAFATSAAGGYNGSFAGADKLSFTDAAGLAGKNVFVWVTNGSDQNLLMKAVGGAAGDFLFKADGDIPNSGAITIKALALDAFELELGTFTATGANSAYGGSYVLNTVVPEPSAMLLGAFGAIGLLRRRRA